MFITFYGAAHEVTGSCSLLETNNQKILVDCGMFQGSNFNEGKNSEPFLFDPKTLNAVLVTHAHLDHVGRLPILIKKGYQGPIYCTKPTKELTEIVLKDAFEIMTYDNRKFGRPILFSEADVSAVVGQMKTVEYGVEILHPTSLLQPTGEVKFTFYDAGHIFGSAFIQVDAEGKRVVFSGDVGNIDVPILRDTEMLPENIDALVCESTYGDRIHESVTNRQGLVEGIIATAIKKGGVLMIPSFSIERTQELIYELNDLIDRQHKLSRVPIFLDSPMAIHAIKVFEKYPQYYDEEATKLFKEGEDFFDFPGLTLTLLREESLKINHVPAPKIIIAGAGMMNGGRILHHAVRYLSDPQNTLLIIGYQANGTLGRDILDGKSPVQVMGERVEVKCAVKAIGALSAHADQNKFLDWIGGCKMTPKKVYLNHGEPAASEALASRLGSDLNITAIVVTPKLRVEI